MRERNLILVTAMLACLIYPARSIAQDSKSQPLEETRKLYGTLNQRKRPAVAVWTGVSLEVMLAMWTEAIVSTWSDDGHIHSTRRT